MNKVFLGLILGGVLGLLDGVSSWLAPEARPMIVEIIIGSTIKGLITGVLIGVFARRVQSLPLGIIFGLGVGLVLSFLVAAMQPEGQKYYFEIMLPGGIVGVLVGYATQRYGRAGSVVTSTSSPESA